MEHLVLRLVQKARLMSSPDQMDMVDDVAHGRETRAEMAGTQVAGAQLAGTLCWHVDSLRAVLGAALEALKKRLEQAI